MTDKILESCRIVFSGSGGQGVITASIIFAEAAVLYEGMSAVQSQVYGPAARGGAARSDVIISGSEIYFPRVLQPNVLVCLTQEAYNKYSSAIRPGGLLLTDTRYVTTERKVDARQVQLPMYETIMAAINEPIVFNICMLGVIIKLTGLVSAESITKVLETKIPSNFLKINEKALDIGMNLSAG